MGLKFCLIKIQIVQDSVFQNGKEKELELIVYIRE